MLTDDPKALREAALLSLKANLKTKRKKKASASNGHAFTNGSSSKTGDDAEREEGEISDEEMAQQVILEMIQERDQQPLTTPVVDDGSAPVSVEPNAPSTSHPTPKSPVVSSSYLTTDAGLASSLDLTPNTPVALSSQQTFKVESPVLTNSFLPLPVPKPPPVTAPLLSHGPGLPRRPHALPLRPPPQLKPAKRLASTSASASRKANPTSPSVQSTSSSHTSPILPSSESRAS